MSIAPQVNVPVAQAGSVEELCDNVNFALMALYQQLAPVLSSLQSTTKAVVTLDSSTYPAAVSFSSFVSGAPVANGYVTITFSNGKTAQLLARM